MPKAPVSGDYKVVALPSPDTVPARCIQAIDLGVVDNSYQGDGKRDRKLLIIWELPTLKAVFNDDKGEEPFTIFEEMKFSTHKESNFSKLISAWRNKPLTEEEKKYFDYEKLIGKTCLMSYQIKTKGKYRDANIEQATNENSNLKVNTVMALPAAMRETMPAMINEPVVWDWDKLIEGEETFSQDKFKKIWKFIRQKMYTSDQWNECPGAINVDAETTEGAAPQQTQQGAPPAKQPEQGPEVGSQDEGW